MDLESIISELRKRFAAPLPEFYTRRIIIWYDEERAFEENIRSVELPEAKVLELTGTNNFAAKKELAADDTESNYLVYCPLSFDSEEKNWLLNIAMYSEEFRADRNTMWLEEMQLPHAPQVRHKIKEYASFFRVQAHRDRVKKMAGKITKHPMEAVVLATLCGTKEPDEAAIVQAVLAGGTDEENNAPYAKIKKYGALPAFWMLVSKKYGYNEGGDSTLKKLASHVLLTAALCSISENALKGLENQMSPAHLHHCYDLVSAWQQVDEESLREVAAEAEYELKLYPRFRKQQAEALAELECFPCVNECILEQLMREVCNGIKRVEDIRKLVSTRRTKAWYKEVEHYYEGLLQVANMLEFSHAHHEGFHLGKAQEVWRAYTSDYYLMDSYYRKFHLHFNLSLTRSGDGPEDLFKQVADVVERLYGKFLAQLSSNWTAVSEEALSTQGYIEEVNRQRRFYCNKVEGRDTRTFVIISDALRYEVAAELAARLRRDFTCTVEMESMQGVFPTITKFGMAALLPHHRLEVQQKPGGGVSVLADGASTEMPNRDKVLKAANAASVALQYKNIIGLKRPERQELVKNMDVVYIYHDKIDEASHSSDVQVFGACEAAIEELKNLVRIICNDFNGTRICITADHGFLYTYSPLSEEDKVDKTDLKGSMIEYGRRYAITQPGCRAEYLMPVSFEGGMQAFTPRENVRIKMSGGGLNFVHGGISLQEMVVPVLEFKYLRSTKQYQNNREKYDTKPVTLDLLSHSKKITNLSVVLNFLQKEAVCDNRIACTYKLYFTDANGKQISDVVKLIADKETPNVMEREYSRYFNLRSQRYSNHDTYYLVIADESGVQEPQRIEFQIDIPMAFDDFNFF